jgi:hypothetical protein
MYFQVKDGMGANLRAAGNVTPAPVSSAEHFQNDKNYQRPAHTSTAQHIQKRPASGRQREGQGKANHGDRRMGCYFLFSRPAAD